ncbi:MAG: TIGR03668 family PPOX class F420-dependent oxidoreductase [Alphaproteobacteria bacterium]|nr:TIGR03668 family PPOX class F420-dependent oxidoreductase [Alphaproteobacteria bacterium]
MLMARERRFIELQRVGRFATADRQAAPHVVPVCFVLSDDSLHFTIDGKPKLQRTRPLKRLANIAENPQAAIVFDRYDEDWRHLAWVMLHGRAEILTAGGEHERAQAALRVRYPQLQAMAIAGLPVVALRIERVVSWGALDP